MVASVSLYPSLESRLELRASDDESYPSPRRFLATPSRGLNGIVSRSCQNVDDRGVGRKIKFLRGTSAFRGMLFFKHPVCHSSDFVTCRRRNLDLLYFRPFKLWNIYIHLECGGKNCNTRFNEIEKESKRNCSHVILTT